MDTPSRGRPKRPLVLFSVAVILLVYGGAALWQREHAGPDNSVDGLVQRLGMDEDTAVAAQDDLEKRVGVRDTTFWKKLLNSPSDHTRYLATDTLAKQRTPEAGRLLAGLLDDYYSEVRIRAVDTLLDNDPVDGIRPMLSATRDEDASVRNVAL